MAALAIISGHIDGTVPARRKEIDEARARALWRHLAQEMHPARAPETVMPFPEPVAEAVMEPFGGVPAATAYELVVCGACPDPLGVLRVVRLAMGLQIDGTEVPGPVLSAALSHPAGWAPARAVAGLKAGAHLSVFVAEHWRLRQPARWCARTMRARLELATMGAVIRCPRCGRWSELEKFF